MCISVSQATYITLSLTSILLNWSITILTSSLFTVHPASVTKKIRLEIVAFFSFCAALINMSMPTMRASITGTREQRLISYSLLRIHRVQCFQFAAAALNQVSLYHAVQRYVRNHFPTGYSSFLRSSTMRKLLLPLVPNKISPTSSFLPKSSFR